MKSALEMRMLMRVWRNRDPFFIMTQGDVFVFIGDSITDAGRRDDPDGMGFGYVRLFADMLAVHDPGTPLAVLNRGIGGDTIRHLSQRWDRDVLAASPSWLSISIGVNDVWRQLQDPPSPESVFVDEFESEYRGLLTRTRERLPACRVLLCEPTVIGEDEDSPHNRLMPSYLESIHRLGVEFDAVVVPMNQAFWQAKRVDRSRAWTMDGVHPLSCGHMLMAVTFWKVWESIL